MATEFETGILVGLLIGEGHFGGDGRQPQVTLRMHVRHEAMFRWLVETFPGGKLYGPYNHDGRRYFQWMARGAYLRDELLPLLVERVTPELDGYGFQRLQEMRERYAARLSPPDGDDDDALVTSVKSKPDANVDEAAPTDPGSARDTGPATPSSLFDRLRRSFTE